MRGPPVNALPAAQRYAVAPLFLAGVFFMVSAPLFWTQVEAPVGKTVERAAENAELFHRAAPAMAYGFGCLRAGALPLWCDTQLCGTPWLADPLNGVFQPLNAVFLLLPPAKGLAVHAFLSLFLAGLLFTLFCRSLGARHVPAVAGGIVYAYGGASAAFMSRPETAAAVAWAPLVFWALTEHARRPRPATLAAGGVAYGLLLLSGSAPLVLLFTGLLALYAVVGVGPQGTGARPSRGDALKMAALGVLLASAQLVPAAFWISGLVRPLEALLRMDAAGQVPSSTGEFFGQLLAPSPGLLPRMAYFGAAVPALLFSACFQRGMRRTLVFFLAAGGACLLPVVAGAGLLGEMLPPAGWMAGVAFCMAGLTALGVDRLLAPRRDPRSPRLWAPLFFVFAAGAVLFLATPAESKGRIVPVLAALAFFALFRVAWASVLSGAAIAFILFADLFAASANVYQHPLHGGESALSPGTRLARAVQGQALDGRAVVSGDPLGAELSPNAGLSGPFRLEGGAFFALTPEEAAWWSVVTPGQEGTASPPAARPFLRAGGVSPAARLLHLAAVRVVVTDAPRTFEDGAAFRRVESESGVTVLANDGALPRARLVGKWRMVPDAAAALALLTSDGFDIGRECVVSSFLHAGGLRDLRQTEEAPGSARIEEETQGRIVLSCDASAPAMLVLADTCAPGWSATVNGEPAHIYQVNARFRGVLVPAGASMVTMTYRPLPVFAGLAVSLLTLGALLLAAFVEMARAAGVGRAAHG